MSSCFQGSRAAWTVATAVTVALQAGAAVAQPAAEMEYGLPAQPLEQSLRAVSVRSGTSVVAPAEMSTERPVRANGMT